jgi:hypothetical protein
MLYLLELANWRGVLAGVHSSGFLDFIQISECMVGEAFTDLDVTMMPGYQCEGSREGQSSLEELPAPDGAAGGQGQALPLQTSSKMLHFATTL